MTEPAPRKSDLGVRVVSAVVMVAVAGCAFWADGPVLDTFLVAVGLACFWEYSRLIWRAAVHSAVRFTAVAFGIFYIGGAVAMLTAMPREAVAAVVALVAAVDIFAYFTGRTFGGPKIAPRISPSKTWAGLLGGIIGATSLLSIFAYAGPAIAASAPDNRYPYPEPSFALILAVGAAVAVLAQSGDFFESWLKRRAGVKDSSNLLPGHGGVFDRVDGMIPVALVFGLLGHLSR